jgi:hypothetical protein
MNYSFNKPFNTCLAKFGWRRRPWVNLLVSRAIENMGALVNLGWWILDGECASSGRG